MQAATPCAVFVSRRTGGMASIYKRGRIALQNPNPSTWHKARFKHVSAGALASETLIGDGYALPCQTPVARHEVLHADVVGREFANGFANEPRSTGRFRATQTSTVGLEMPN